jgi:hypothetical protein
MKKIYDLLTSEMAEDRPEKEEVLFVLTNTASNLHQRMTTGAEPQRFHASGLKPIVWAVPWPTYVQITPINNLGIKKITTLDFSMDGATLLAPVEKAQEDLLLACPEMLVACMFGQKMSAHNKSLVLFEGITKFNMASDVNHVARIWNVCSDGKTYDESHNVRIALLQSLKTGDYTRDRCPGITKSFLV